MEKKLLDVDEAMNNLKNEMIRELYTIISAQATKDIQKTAFKD